VRGDPQHGIEVNDHLQTSNPHIYAAGDVATAYRFTHMADAMARIVIRNALFFGRARASLLTIPWCTYTDPEIGHVGLDPVTAEARKVEISTFVQEMSGVDRALLDGETEGFVKVHVAADTDRIVGATIVARHASEMIGELTLALSKNIGLGALANVIHPYPTQAEAIRKVADAYNRTRLTPRVATLFDRLMAWRRR
jgi:pyruvate/2-oxoglutarate dehydrogenase complex dihydrolipoamide dehydrogenase (E3) component